MKHWRLDTDNQTLVLASLDNRVPCLIYWGQKLPGDESLEDLIEASKKDWGDNLLDKVPDLSILPEQSANFTGQLGYWCQLIQKTKSAFAFCGAW